MDFIARFSTVDGEPILSGKKQKLGTNFLNEVRQKINDENLPAKDVCGVLEGIELDGLNVLIEPEIAILSMVC